MINVGTQYDTSKKAIEIAQEYPQGVYAAVGLHPSHLETGLIKMKNDKKEIEEETNEECFDREKYKELAKSDKVVAIGEFGLDYYYRPKTAGEKELFKQKQKEVLLKHLDLVQELNLPAIFHCRSAHDDLINILDIRYKIENAKIKGVIHCFTGNWEQAEKYMKMGFYLGFNGIIFKLNLDEIIKKTPLDKILIETDCPYLTPLPAVASAEADATSLTRNEPSYVKYVAEKIALIRKSSFEEVAETTAQNAQKLFEISPLKKTIEIKKP